MADFPPWLTCLSAERYRLALHIQPGAKKTSFDGQHGEQLKIRLAAPPVDGKANEALIRFLADALDLRRSAITLVSGQTSRHKRVEIEALTPAALAILRAQDGADMG